MNRCPEVNVPEPYFQEVPHYKYTEVPMVQVRCDDWGSYGRGVSR